MSARFQPSPRPPRAGMAVLCALLVSTLTAPAQNGYLRAPEDIRQILDAPALPQVSLSPARDRMLLTQSRRYPPLADLAAPYLPLAGHRIDPANSGPARPPRNAALWLKTLPDGDLVPVVIPKDSKISPPAWSPDGTQLAFARFTTTATELWVIDAKSAAAKRIRSVALSAGFDAPFQWMPDSQRLLCRLIPEKRPPVPPANKPGGPVTLESDGRPTRVRTYSDLLSGPRDAALYEHHAASQLALVTVRSAQVKPVGQPDIFFLVEVSPDGEHLLVERAKRPFSYQLPAAGFARRVEVWGVGGSLEHHLPDVPEQGDLPPGGVVPGPRRYHWRPTSPATLVWVEALDGGFPERSTPYRDRVMKQRAPFMEPPAELFRTQSRFSALTWSERGYLALIRDFSAGRRWARTFLFNPDNAAEEPTLLWSRSTENRHGDPGVPLTKLLPTGQRVMRVQDQSIFLSGASPAPEGERPFLDRLDLATLATRRLFESDADHYETLVALTQDDGSQFITRREGPVTPPNYHLREPRLGMRQALTQFPDPAPAIRQVRRIPLNFTRADGLPLSATLYLPPAAPGGAPLPAVFWAYPREFVDADAAAQGSGGTNRFVVWGGASQLYFALHGYAVIDNFSMPVLGDPREANDTFVQQITDNARAALDAAAATGWVDAGRVGVAGHSYGAFMAANLLAHSDLFRAGIARSGAYNRTLTPFGFQNESRTLWQAPEMYLGNSPFLAADRINEPLLLIHGEADDNPGTPPQQSERMFQALKGNGGTARLVLLPHESHNYVARESIEHVLAEMLAWFDRHVKNAPPGDGSVGGGR